MAAQLSVDTTFLIDLYRERLTGESSPDAPAHRFLTQRPDTQLLLPTAALGEFAEGFDRADHPIVTTVRDGFTLIPADGRVALVYARVARHLRSSGQLIGSNDLWIGCTALCLGVGIVTANEAHFRRIPGLDVVTYR